MRDFDDDFDIDGFVERLDDDEGFDPDLAALDDEDLLTLRGYGRLDGPARPAPRPAPAPKKPGRKKRTT